MHIVIVPDAHAAKKKRIIFVDGDFGKEHKSACMLVKRASNLMGWFCRMMRSHNSFVTFLALMLILGCVLVGCCLKPKTFGNVYVSRPQVFTRERLVISRER